MISVCYHTAIMLADRIGIPQLRDLAGRSEQVVADIALAELDRIADLLSEPAVGERTLSVRVRFSEHGQGFPELECQVDGVLPLVCQRCLETVEWQVQLDFRLAIVMNEADLERATEKFDAVVADEHGFDLKAAITDEVLSDIPLAPRHTEAQACSAEFAYLAEPGEAAGNMTEDVNRPFAGLSAMLSRNRSDD